MVLQQCLACNSLTTGLSRSCACGHVLEDATRYIGGKRYSEYRAMLYSRLETQRNKRDDSNQRINQQQPLGEPKDLMAVISERPNFKPVKRRTVAKRTANKKKIRKESSSTLKRQRATVKSVTAVPQELLSRFPRALMEINRRIMGQNLMWLALQLES
ncbi:hypothetical protein OS493_017809 [Desmophyllum pertusum]|uniref:Uncharacterized protein n=1 Tax=Desmophyllum pertusum TaxID=174260 RepID=A0A9W9ZD47_9CNID|nr:hypothetical protein OS493_017809 [Desmophyllum pertusum]